MSIRRTDAPHCLRLPAGLLLPVLLAATSACASSATASGDHVVSLVRHGQFEEARVEAEKLSRAFPNDARAQRLRRDAEVAYILDQGRRAVFQDEAEQGLVHFKRALELNPANLVVLDWITKTRLQLAEASLDQATAADAEGDLEGAEGHYESVLAVLPKEDVTERVERTRTQAKLGLAQVLLNQNYRAGQSRSYYQDGVRDFREFLLGRAQHDFGAALLYDSNNSRARRRLDEVEAVLASERLAKAATLESAGLYHAAGKEYRLALLLDPDNMEAQSGFDRMDLETRAARTLAEAEMSVFRGELERASDLLSQADDFTLNQVDEVGRLEADIEDKRLRKTYNAARSLERDYHYPEAASSYRALLEEVEFYEDAIARLVTIEEFITLAEEYYTAALDASTDEETAGYLRRIPVFWPEYRDVEERLAVLDAKLAAKPKKAGDE